MKDPAKITNVALPMNYFTKTHSLIFILLSFAASSCNKHLTGNPYIDRKVNASQQRVKEDQKIITKQKKAYKKEIEEAKKNRVKSTADFFDKKKYKYLTKKRKAKYRKMMGHF